MEKIFNKKDIFASSGELLTEVVKKICGQFCMTVDENLIIANSNANGVGNYSDGEGSTLAITSEYVYRRISNDELDRHSSAHVLWTTRSGHSVEISEYCSSIPSDGAEITVSIGEEGSENFYPTLKSLLEQIPAGNSKTLPEDTKFSDGEYITMKYINNNLLWLYVHHRHDAQPWRLKFSGKGIDSQAKFDIISELASKAAHHNGCLNMNPFGNVGNPEDYLYERKVSSLTKYIAWYEEQASK